MIDFVAGAIFGMSYAWAYPEYVGRFFQECGRIVESIGLSAKSF